MTNFNLKPGHKGKDLEEIGIEIEVEGDNLPYYIPSYWGIVKDSSLRGESAEYVLRAPIPRDEVPIALNYLFSKFVEKKATAYRTIRGSVHVHFNMYGWTKRQIYTFITLYTIFDEILVDYCGPYRVGNYYCLRVKDAEMLLTFLEKSTFAWSSLNTDLIRYSSINLASLFKHGSLEFRAFRSSIIPKEIQSWIDILCHLKDMSKTYKDPREVLIDFSSSRSKGFYEKILGHLLPYKPEYSDKLYTGARLIQTFAYTTDWYNKSAIKEPKPVKGSLTPWNNLIIDEYAMPNPEIPLGDTDEV